MIPWLIAQITLVHLVWTNPDEMITSNEVWRSFLGPLGGFERIYTGPPTNSLRTGLHAPVHPFAWFYVRACNTSGCSERSNIVKVEL